MRHPDPGTVPPRESAASAGRRPALRRRLLSPSPETLVVAGFAAVILLGSLILSLPVARPGHDFDYLTALFTATSATCVTGLSVVDFPAYYSGVGELSVLVMIQLGGLGVMTGAALVYRLVGRRLSLRSQAALQDSLLQENLAAEFRYLFRNILLATFTLELLGALVLLAGFAVRLPWAEAAWAALFQSVSAFCNAGFSTFSESLLQFATSPLIIVPIMALIVLGGLGGIVLVELAELGILRGRRATDGSPARSRIHRMSLHTRTVLWMTALLLTAGFALLLAIGATPAGEGIGARVAAAAFQSVTARTAGFNTVLMSSLPVGSLLVLMGLMFIGGSPGSCAGGVKTTTVAIWGAELWAALRRREDTVIMDRAIPHTIVRRALLLINLSMLWNFAGVLLLMLFETSPEIGLVDIIFEQISAFATVGLSTGITPDLSSASQVWIIITMFVGRLGPLLLASWALQAQRARVRQATGRVLIG